MYGKITVFSAPQSQLSALTFGRFDSGSTLPPAFDDSLRPERLWAGYMDRPLVPENLGAPEALDPQSHRSLDDWNTFHECGTRLVKYLKHVGYNGLMLSVLADGSTIYPSRVLEPTPRYDTGVFFGSGQDPRRKDALEMFFRLFDREQLTLIPALQFASPLPETRSAQARRRNRRSGAAMDRCQWPSPAAGRRLGGRRLQPARSARAAGHASRGARGRRAGMRRILRSAAWRCSFRRKPTPSCPPDPAASTIRP